MKTHRSMPSALAKKSAKPHYVLSLYVTGATVLSQRAIVNITDICKEHLEGRYDLEVIDVHQNPALASSAQVVAAPTLVKRLPLPLRRLIGDFSDRQHVLVGLNLKRKT